MRSFVVRSTFAVALLSLSLSLAACGAKNDPIVPQERLRPEVTQVSLPNMPLGHPDLGTLSVLSRGPRRMSIEQLERSLESIADAPAGSIRLPPSLALALGRPDYLRVTEESLEPSPLFMKFMMDLGAYICTAISDSDPMRPADQRVLSRFSTFDENARYLVLRFTGLEGPATDEYLPRLRSVYDAARVGARGDKGGWEAVCIALFTSPEFLLY